MVEEVFGEKGARRDEEHSHISEAHEIGNKSGIDVGLAVSHGA